jgi:hypothetical protein
VLPLLPDGATCRVAAAVLRFHGGEVPRRTNLRRAKAERQEHFANANVQPVETPQRSQERRLSMCDYSLHLVASRSATVGDTLIATDFAKSITRGFAAVGQPDVAVCLLPGTELAFEREIQYDRAFSLFGKARVDHKVARFRQVNVDDPNVHHDALEFPDGQIVLVTRLTPGQRATVLQMPASPQGHSATESAAERGHELIEL